MLRSRFSRVAQPPIVKVVVAKDFDGLSLRVLPSFAEGGPNELVLESRNLSGERRLVDTRSLGPTLLTKQRDLASLGPPSEWLRAAKDYTGLSGFGTFVKLDNNRAYVEFDYRVTYTPGLADEAGKIATFIISARPVRFGKTGNRSFVLDESGVVRATSADRPATKDDSGARQ